MEDINNALLEEFPKLKEGGGFEFLRKQQGSSVLTLIAPPREGFSVKYFQAVSRTGVFYIRPIQSNLSLDAQKVSASASLYFTSTVVVTLYKSNTLPVDFCVIVYLCPCSFVFVFKYKW